MHGTTRSDWRFFFVDTRVPEREKPLGTGLGLIIGAKLAAPDKFCVNFMGDAAFGMTGLDFETAVGCGIPITTIVLNNSSGGHRTPGTGPP
jgi:thiamine pyrophosphate-dependent acetolactate synthase large subunit-like protein